MTLLPSNTLVVTIQAIKVLKAFRQVRVLLGGLGQGLDGMHIKASEARNIGSATKQRFARARFLFLP